MKSISAVVALIVLIGLAWTYRDRLGLRESARAAMPDIELPAVLRSLSTPAPGSGPATGVRKCVDGGQTLYTNGACPAGSREQAVAGGSVSVLPAPAAVVGGTGAAKAPGSGGADRRADPSGPAAKDAQIDRLIETGRTR